MCTCTARIHAACVRITPRARARARAAQASRERAPAGLHGHAHVHAHVHGHVRQHTYTQHVRGASHMRQRGRAAQAALELVPAKLHARVHACMHERRLTCAHGPREGHATHVSAGACVPGGARARTCRSTCTHAPVCARAHVCVRMHIHVHREASASLGALCAATWGGRAGQKLRSLEPAAQVARACCQPWLTARASRCINEHREVTIMYKWLLLMNITTCTAEGSGQRSVLITEGVQAYSLTV